MPKIIIAELNPAGERLELQYFPQSISTSRDASFAKIEMPGANDPIARWTGGSTKMTLECSFASVAPDGKDVLRTLNWLKSLTYKNKQNIINPVRLIYGDMFRDYVWYVASVQDQYGTISPDKKAPINAKATISLIPQANEQFFKETVRTWVS